MNIRFLFLVLALASPPGALASPPASTATTFTVDCEQPAWPTLREFAERRGFDAFDPAYRTRQRMIIEALRACRRGADRLLLVLQPDPVPSMLVRRGR